MRRSLNPIVAITVLIVISCLTGSASVTNHQRFEAVEELQAAAAGKARVVMGEATGTARLVTFERGAFDLGFGTIEEQARQLFGQHGKAFGIDGNTELVAGPESMDHLGRSHQTFTQRYRGISVWGGMLRIHGDNKGSLATVNGLVIPDIAPLSVDPSLDAATAEEFARSAAAKKRHQNDWPRLHANNHGLTVVRENLTKGLPGRAHLTWEVTVSDGEMTLERLFVDAHTGVIVERVSEIHDITRRVYDVNFSNLIWSEGDPEPYTADTTSGNAGINTIIVASKNTYDLFSALSGGTWLSWNGNDTVMSAIYRDSSFDCANSPNAAWFGDHIGFCPVLTIDDVVAHEWTHAYTQATHDLIYQWQSGALNESYSDIFGETVDFMNGIGADDPGGLRSDDTCSSFGGSAPAVLEVHSPAEVAGNYNVGNASFNPVAPWSVTGTLELVNASSGTASEGCSALTDFTAGNVAILDRGNCLFVDKVSNAAQAGAIGVIVVNQEGNSVITMAGDGRQPIPALMVGRSDGNALKAVLDQGVSVTMSQTSGGDSSYRWLQGEDAGTLRDLWNPACKGDPGKVSSGNYFCGEADGGGVHTNSGVPNHAYALLVDGGTYNNVTVGGIGLTKAAHIYWRAMSVYQVLTTNFPDHADLLELSCQDLIGTSLTDLETGNIGAEVIIADNCAQLANAMEAVEMRLAPTQCGFLPLLAADAPSLEGTIEIFSETFSTEPADWTMENFGTSPSYDARDWQWITTAPEGADGGAMFATDRPGDVGNCINENEDQTGVMRLTSPAIMVPGATEVLLVFDHYVATEQSWDGGNVKISVNGGDFSAVSASTFVFNRYNQVLQPTGSGNTNPMAGEFSFSGTNGGSFESSWGQSQVDILKLAAPGDEIRFRFDFGVDWCTGLDGWYLDTVKVMARIPAPRRAGDRVGP